jgi:threonine/homoserine efflux transporter RhtA
MGWSEAKRNWHHYIILRRIAIAGLIFLAWFFPWYMRRYHGFEWQVISIFHTISLGFSSAVLYFIWDCARMHGRE